MSMYAIWSWPMYLFAATASAKYSKYTVRHPWKWSLWAIKIPPPSRPSNRRKHTRCGFRQDTSLGHGKVLKAMARSLLLKEPMSHHTYQSEPHFDAAMASATHALFCAHMAYNSGEWW